MKLSLHTFNLQLANTFTISHESRDVQPNIIVTLSQDGHTGYGEAVATSYYGISVKAMMEKLESLRRLIESSTATTAENFWEEMHPHLIGHTFEQCALDIAAHDLFGKIEGIPLYKKWGLDPSSGPLTNYTIGIDTIEKMIAKMEAMPWPIYKIKLGTDHDVEIVQALRQHTDALFRVDANTAWTAEQTIEYAPRLKELGVEFIEQPLKANDWKGMEKVYKHSALPVIADESCHVESDVAKCAGYFHGINIKLMKCGGLSPARRMIKEAKALGMKVMAGCMTESSVGISAIAQLLPLLDYVDMDGALLLKEDIATGVCIEFGKVQYPERNGTGAALLR